MSSLSPSTQQPQTSATDIQSLTSTHLPFLNPNMNFFFMDVLGSSVYGDATPGECYEAADHCQLNNLIILNNTVCDWLDDLWR